MPSIRRYDDPCGIARALDVVGERWALLVARELIFGPKRFVQLRDPPAGVAIYELTARGQALEPVLLELGRWGTQQPMTADGELSVNALMVALKTVFDPATAVHATFALRVDGDWFRVTVAGDTIDIARGRSERPAVTFDTDAATLRSVAFGREPISDAERDGRLTVDGDRLLAECFTRMFPPPATSHHSQPAADDTIGSG
jgi:DNA-binding HxlR family transcriptional regulator